MPCLDALHMPPRGFLFDRDIVWECPACGARQKFVTSNTPVCDAPLPKPCPECGGCGYEVHPQNGWVKGVRCRHGCPVKCSVCYDPNCTNPDGQH